MAEVFSFREGSAQIYTGNASAVEAFVQNARAVGRAVVHSYRAPAATTRTYIELERPATLTIQSLRSDSRLAKLAYAATGGSLHCHISHAHVGVSAGVWLWSGTISEWSHSENEGALVAQGIQAEFQNWSAY